jgi:Tfp pilus assembly protein PilF
MVPTLLDHNYYPDGQILEEDYVYGSFVQSKMYNNEVMCNDCHNVHSGKLVFDGNELCAQCHLPQTYDSYNHHFHKYKGEEGTPVVLQDRAIEVGEGALCINCHMPARYYMGNDLRNDHSFRVPRPDLTLSIGTPNACNQCHEDKSVEWSADYITKWYGIKRKAHFGTVIAAARENKPGTGEALVRIAEDDIYLPIIRATAISYLSNFSTEEINKSLKLLVQDAEPLIRYTVLRTFVTSDINDHLQTILPLLNDPVKAVRTQAALRLTEVPVDQIPGAKKTLLNNVLAEYKSAMEYLSDFPGGRQNLGIMYANMGEFGKAEKQYKEAVSIDSLFYPAKVNLAMVLNQQGKNDEAELVFKDIIKKHPDFIDAYYSLGLLLAENNKYDEAADYLNHAAKLMPDRSRVFYNLGLILQFQKKTAEAEQALKRALELEPNNGDFMYALADHYIKRGNFPIARKYALQLKAAYPAESIGQEILDYISQLENQSN